MFSIPGVPPGLFQDLSRLRRKYEAEQRAHAAKIREQVKRIASEERERYLPKKLSDEERGLPKKPTADSEEQTGADL